MIKLNKTEYTFDPVVGLDIETTGLSYFTSEIVVVAVHSGGDSYVWEAAKMGPEFMKRMLRDIKLAVMHNAKFDVGFLYHNYGVMVPAYCTWMASKILNNGLDFSNSLKNCLYHYLGVEDTAQENKDIIRKSFTTRGLTQEQLDYVVADIGYLLDLKAVLDTEIEREGLKKIMALEHALLPVVIRMEHRGVRFDVERLKRFIKVWEWARAKCTKDLDAEVMRLYATTGKGIQPLFSNMNYSSPAQVVDIFNTFGQKPPKKKNEDGEMVASVGYDELQIWLNKHPKNKLVTFIELLMKYREFDKLLSTYGTTLVNSVRNGYLHGELKQLGTLSGRFSSSNPNLQNIPSSGYGLCIRSCFLPDEGDNMNTCDMKGAELRIAGDRSQDPMIMDNFLKGADMHSILASKVFSIIFGQPVEVSKSKEPIDIGGHMVVPDEMRTAQKNVNFAVIYTAGPDKIESMLMKYFIMAECKKGTAKAISETLKRELKNLNYYLMDNIAKANEYKILRGEKFGRIRHFPKGGFGDAANNEIQQINAEAIKVAMINVDKYLTKNDYGRILLTVHDELVCSIRKDKSLEIAEEIKKIMSESLGYFLRTIPGDAEYKIGKHWMK